MQRQKNKTKFSDDDLRNPPDPNKVTHIEKNKLKENAQERAKDQPLLQKVIKFFRKDNEAYREIIINSEPLEKRVALLTDGILEKFEVERNEEERMVGAIFKGHIQNHEPGLKAAFVDINESKNAFLHYWDILPEAADSSIEFIEDERPSKQKENNISLKDIPSHYPIGSELMVQITKAQIGSKGPRTTTNISLPGRFLVLMPFGGKCGVSRKIEDIKERDRLKKILKKLTIPEGMGVILRTAGEGKKLRYFIRDLHILLKKWDAISIKNESTDEPCCLYREPDILERTVRDFLTEEVDRVLIDNEADYQAILELVTEISPRSKSKIHLFNEKIPIFERFNIERQVEQTFQKKVPLPSGGEIVIEETEALTAIDINTGGHKGKNNDGNSFILQCNLEAAIEAARQIRLRNIGGLIIVDFIDMKNKKDRRTVYDCMRQEMDRDKTKHHILPISPLGIMQMTRQRSKESMLSGVYTSCPYCHATGIVKSSQTMSVEVQRSIVNVMRRLHSDKTVNLKILLHPTTLKRLSEEDEHVLIELENAYNVKLSFRSDPSYHVENFKIINVETGEEVS